MATWTSKYAPKNTSEVFGQSTQITRLKNFLNSKSKKKAAILHGFYGSGKTSSIYAIANELDYELLELGASDVRNAKALNDILGSATGQMSLFGGSKIILIDDLDGISGQHDRGAVPALAKLIAKSSFPILMTSNDVWAKRFAPLRKLSELIEFAPLETEPICRLLNQIAEKELIQYSSEAIELIANKSGGDARAAINDLQILSERSKSVSTSEVSTLSGRNKIDDMCMALSTIFASHDFKSAASALDNVDSLPRDWISWIDENMPDMYKNPVWINNACDKISSADIFNRRIMKSQYWRLIVYIKILLSAGIALSKDGKIIPKSKYRQSSRGLKIWLANARYQKKKCISSKLALTTHSSEKRTLKDVFPIVKNILLTNSISEEIGLDQDEIAWLNKSV